MIDILLRDLLKAGMTWPPNSPPAAPAGSLICGHLPITWRPTANSAPAPSTERPSAIAHPVTEVTEA
jgi:hypothetical protein